MTEAGWTREVPKEIGVYWWRSNAADNHPWIVRVHRGGLGLMLMQTIGGPLVPIGEGGEWIGPISPTDRQQGRVEGLRDSMDDLRKRMDRDDGDTDNDVWKHLAWCELQIKAQAAQDEKGVGDGRHNIHD